MIVDFINNNSEQTKYESLFVDKINMCQAYFDSRILSFDINSKNEILNHLIWRSVKDCNRNAIQSYAYYLIGHHKVNNMKGKQMIQLLETTKGLSWEKDIPLWQKYGIFIKKKLATIQTENGCALRTKMCAVSFKPYFSFDILDFFLSAYYDENKLTNVVVEEYILTQN